MFWKKYRSLLEGVEVSDPAADVKSGVRIGKYRLTAQAIYRPDDQYLPLSTVEKIVQDKGSAHVTGCCIGCLPVDRLVVTAGGKPFLFDFDSARQAAQAGAAIGRGQVAVEKKEDVLKIF